jgi:hypothetical protein
MENTSKIPLWKEKAMVGLKGISNDRVETDFRVGLLYDCRLFQNSETFPMDTLWLSTVCFSPRQNKPYSFPTHPHTVMFQKGLPSSFQIIARAILEIGDDVDLGSPDIMAIRPLSEAIVERVNSENIYVKVQFAQYNNVLSMQVVEPRYVYRLNKPLLRKTTAFTWEPKHKTESAMLCWHRKWKELLEHPMGHCPPDKTIYCREQKIIQDTLDPYNAPKPTVWSLDDSAIVGLTDSTSNTNIALQPDETRHGTINAQDRFMSNIHEEIEDLLDDGSVIDEEAFDRAMGED